MSNAAVVSKTRLLAGARQHGILGPAVKTADIGISQDQYGRPTIHLDLLGIYSRAASRHYRNGGSR